MRRDEQVVENIIRFEFPILAVGYFFFAGKDQDGFRAECFSRFHIDKTVADE